MKIKVFQSILALFASALVSYGFYTFSKGANVDLIAIVTFVQLVIMSVILFGIEFKIKRTSVILKVLSGIFLIIMLVMNTAFGFFDFSVPLFIILNGIVLLIWLMISSFVYESKQ